jgi:tetratricopeptide (TPR) repeat protein
LKAVKWGAAAAEWATNRDLAESRRHWQKVRELLNVCEDCDDSYRAAIKARQALIEINWKLGADIEATRELFEEGVALAQARNDHTVTAGLEAAFAMAQLFVGRVEDGLTYLEKAVQTAGKSDDHELNLQLVSRLAYMHLLSGHLHKALKMFDLSVELVNDVDASDGRAHARTTDQGRWSGGFRALPMVYLGQYAEAARVHADALAALRDSQERGTETTMQGFGVTLSWFLGDAEGALEFARKQLLMAGRETAERCCRARRYSFPTCAPPTRALVISTKALRWEKKPSNRLATDVPRCSRSEHACTWRGPYWMSIRHAPKKPCTSLWIWSNRPMRVVTNPS